jgi:hypothetical protein
MPVIARAVRVRGGRAGGGGGRKAEVTHVMSVMWAMPSHGGILKMML